MVPDGAFYPSLDRKWPTIALEVGYTESYEDLVQNALLLLKGSKGKIGLVILVKLQPLEEGETAFESGFVEVWGYDCDSRKCIKFGKQVSYYVYSSKKKVGILTVSDALPSSLLLYKAENHFVLVEYTA
jgi:hypothetical protein